MLGAKEKCFVHATLKQHGKEKSHCCPDATITVAYLLLKLLQFSYWSLVAPLNLFMR